MMSEKFWADLENDFPLSSGIVSRSVSAIENNLNLTNSVTSLEIEIVTLL